MKSYILVSISLLLCSCQAKLPVNVPELSDGNPTTCFVGTEGVNKVIFDEQARKEANVELESTSRTYQVRGLEETPEQKAERVEIIDGHEVPRDWELEDEDKKAYIEYLKQLENDEDEHTRYLSVFKRSFCE